MSVSKNIKANISRDGDKFRVSYRYLDPVSNKYKNTCKRGFKLKREAKSWMNNELPAIIARLEQKKKSIDTMTMEDLIEEYCQYKKIHVRITTFETKENIIKTKILPYFKDKYVVDIEPIDIINWQIEMSKPIKKVKKVATDRNGTKKPITENNYYSETYLRTINTQLNCIFNYATRVRRLPQSPCKGIERLGDKKAPEREIWTPEEFNRFIETQEDKPSLYYAYRTLFWTGMRESELLGIHYKNVDFEKNIIYVKEAYHKVKDKIDKKAKTATSYRAVRVPKDIMNELMEYTDGIYGLNSNTRIFENSKKELLNNLKKGSEIAGLHYITVHCLRHSYISMCVQNGLPFTTIKEQVGHSEYLQTLHYSHSYKDASDHLAHTIENILSGG